MTDVDPWCVLEGSNRTFVISNRGAIHPPIVIDFDVTKQGRKVAERDAWTICEALNDRDSALREPKAAPTETAKTPDWEKVADSLLSHGGSIQKVDATAASVLLFLSYALRDGLDASAATAKSLSS
jgi:hypothetical protein